MYSTLQFIVSQLENRHIDTNALAEKANISSAVLADPWPYLSAQQYHDLVEGIYKVSNDPAIGLNLNDQFKTYHLGVPGYAALTSDTFSTARNIIMQYRMLKDPYIVLNHQLTLHDWIMQLTGLYPVDETTLRFSIEGQLVRTQRFFSDITGYADPIEAICVSYPAPEYAELYSEMLACPVQFDQKENSMAFNRDILNYALPSANPSVHQFCIDECQKRMQQLEVDNPFRDKVYQELLRAHQLSKHSLLNLYELSNRLFIAPRTLRRKLLAENTSFKQICNELRHDLAIQYLEHHTFSTKEIAYLLGYSSVNNFHRAFKQWTGVSISDYQK